MSWSYEDALANEREPTKALSENECWSRLEEAEYGRVVTSAAGQIDIFTVNHRPDGRTILFRTAAGTKLVELTIHSDVIFQIDGKDDDEAFSVVVKGRAEELQTSRETEAAEHSGVHPWAPEEKDRWVRITPREVTGRSFHLA
ncbi:pyridoxamine 5'-phosphate oxidase family protein [Microbacterium sp. X-17]|uniref:pyridoxamine 5'-phosphate oxidase family protein n=1 Tax=Microbacterium sp. X-17 TaxID=3144404 RepID=UPI0031F4DD0C